MERRQDPVDRRVNRLYLTDTVQGLMRALRGTAAGVRRDALGDLDEGERERFVDTLIRIRTNLLGLDDIGPDTQERGIALGADD